VNSSNGEVEVTSTWPTQDDTRHRPATWNHHAIIPSRDERSRIHELEGHVARRAFRGREMSVARGRATAFWVGGMRGAGT
jgi:hypothetical protein